VGCFICCLCPALTAPGSLEPAAASLAHLPTLGAGCLPSGLLQERVFAMTSNHAGPQLIGTERLQQKRRVLGVGSLPRAVLRVDVVLTFCFPSVPPPRGHFSVGCVPSPAGRAFALAQCCLWAEALLGVSVPRRSGSWDVRGDEASQVLCPPRAARRPVRWRRETFLGVSHCWLGSGCTCFHFVHLAAARGARGARRRQCSDEGTA